MPREQYTPSVWQENSKDFFACKSFRTGQIYKIKHIWILTLIHFFSESISLAKLYVRNKLTITSTLELAYHLKGHKWLCVKGPIYGNFQSDGWVCSRTCNERARAEGSSWNLCYRYAINNWLKPSSVQVQLYPCPRGFSWFFTAWLRELRSGEHESRSGEKEKRVSPLCDSCSPLCGSLAALSVMRWKIKKNLWPG